MVGTMKVMSPDHREAPRHTGLAIAGIVAIPFLSVTLAAWLGDAASSTDPREAIAGAVALIGGLRMSLLVRRLITSVDRHVRGVVRFVAATIRPLPGTALDLVAATRATRPEDHHLPVLAFVPAEVGRRGPPIRLR